MLRCNTAHQRKISHESSPHWGRTLSFQPRVCSVRIRSARSRSRLWPTALLYSLVWFIVFSPFLKFFNFFFFRERPEWMDEEEPPLFSVFFCEENITLSLLGQTNWFLADFHFSVLAFHVSPSLPLFSILSLHINPVFISWQICMSGGM